MNIVYLFISLVLVGFIAATVLLYVNLRFYKRMYEFHKGVQEAFYQQHRFEAVNEYCKDRPSAERIAIKEHSLHVLTKVREAM